MIRRVLLLLEDGDDETHAVDVTRSLAERGALEIYLLRVEEWPVFGSCGAYGWSPAFRAGNLAAVQQSLGETALPVRALSPDAVSSAAILERATAGRISLIVLSHHQEGLWTRLLLARRAQRILRESPIPVLTVPDLPPRNPANVSRVLYVHDGGRAALQGAEAAIQIAQFYEAPVDLLEMCAPPAPAPREMLLPRWPFQTTRPPPDRRTFSPETLSSLFRKRDVSVTTLPVVEDPLASVSRWVRQRLADLVILSESWDNERVCASLFRQLLETLRVPLLVIRERPRLAPEDAGPGMRFRL